MKRTITNLIERVGLRSCTMVACPCCGEIGLRVTCPDTGTTYYVHTTDFKKVCKKVATLAAAA